MKVVVFTQPINMPSGLWKYISHHFWLFIAETQTHGYRYLVLNRYLMERVYWTAVLFAISILTIWFIVVEYKTFIRSPTITVEQPLLLPVTEIGFPAIAICPTNLISKNKLWKYSKKM